MKGALACDDVRGARRLAAGRGAREVRLRARRGGRGRRAPLDRRADPRGRCDGDFAITGEPTDLHIGVQAKGVLRRPRRGTRDGRARLDAVARRQRDPQGPRRVPPHRDAALQPRVLRPLRPARRSTSRASTAATRSTRCPTAAAMDVDIRYLPNQDPGEILVQIRAIADTEIVKSLHARAGDRLAQQPVRARAARRASAASIEGEALSIGRDGASRRGLVPRGRHPGRRVRPGRRRPPRPRGVGVDRLAARATARRSATSSRGLPAYLERGTDLRAVEGGLA